jgi:hypothetical protein
MSGVAWVGTMTGVGDACGGGEPTSHAAITTQPAPTVSAAISRRVVVSP